MYLLITLAVIYLIFRIIRYNQSFKRDLKEYIPYYKKKNRFGSCRSRKNIERTKSANRDGVWPQIKWT